MPRHKHHPRPTAKDQQQTCRRIPAYHCVPMHMPVLCNTRLPASFRALDATAKTTLKRTWQPVMILFQPLMPGTGVSDCSHTTGVCFGCLRNFLNCLTLPCSIEGRTTKTCSSFKFVVSLNWHQHRQDVAEVLITRDSTHRQKPLTYPIFNCQHTQL